MTTQRCHLTFDRLCFNLQDMRSTLHESAKHGDAATTEYLLTAGADVNTRDRVRCSFVSSYNSFGAEPY